MSWKLRAAAGATLLMLAACNQGSYPVDIFPEMHNQPNHRRLQPERPHAAAGAVPVSGGRVPYSYTQARALQNPVQSTPETRRQAQNLYAVNCAACHGDGGRGDGPVAKYFRSNPAAPVPPTDLGSEQVRNLTDGELYWIAANGLGNMPAFGDELTDEQLWTVVLAIRDLPQDQR